MTIREMHAWLKKVEPGPENCAVRESFEQCLQNAETVGTLAQLIDPLNGTDEVAYLLSLGHFIACAALNQMLNGCALPLVAPKGTRKPSAIN